MAPDLECTFWFDGVPPLLGGRGDEWLHCCIEHDLSTEAWQASNMTLYDCVAAAGYEVMAAVIYVGVATLGTLLVLVTRRRFRRSDRRG